jgi:cytochrome P450
MTKTVVSLRDLLSDDGRRDPYANYARLHRLGPVCRLDGTAGYDFMICGYAAANAALRDPALRLEDTGYLDRTRRHWRRHPVLLRLKDSVFFTNGAEHARVRRLLGKALTPRRVTELEPAIARMTTALLDRMAELGADVGPVNFMSEFALPLPSNVIGELLGIPEADRAWFRPRVMAISAIFELDGSTWRNMNAADTAANELTEYFAALAARRRAEPRDDLISTLLRLQREDGEQISDEELLGNLLTLYNAGFVTTTHMFGHGLALLMRNPRWRQRLRTDPDFVASYLEEVLRFEPPAHFVVRWAAQTTSVAGVEIAENSKVLVALGAANRDPDRFAEPDVFDPTRSDSQPLTFGAGPHYCLGAALTRAEGRVALPMLLDRFPRLAMGGAPDHPRQLMFRGYGHLPVILY